MFQAFSGFFTGIFKIITIASIAVFAPFVLVSAFFLLFYFIKGKRIKKRTVKRKKPVYSCKQSILKRLYIDFPRRLILDIYERDPDAFDTFGVHIFAGEQGSGKSIAAMHFVKMIKERNPACSVASNIDIDFQDDQITDWRDLLNKNNGIYGQVVILDELQNWFSSNESRNFPPDMLTEITQQRKQRKCIVGTSQVFTRISKPIREQVTLLYRPLTVAGCLTFVRVYKLSLTEDGTVDKMKLKQVYFFVHDDDLRNCYDTYQRVQRQSLLGFKDSNNNIIAS